MPHCRHSSPTVAAVPSRVQSCRSLPAASCPRCAIITPVLGPTVGASAQRQTIKPCQSSSAHERCHTRGKRIANTSGGVRGASVGRAARESRMDDQPNISIHRRHDLFDNDAPIAVVGWGVLTRRGVMNGDGATTLEKRRPAFIGCASSSGRLIATERQHVDRDRPTASDFLRATLVHFDPVFEPRRSYVPFKMSTKRSTSGFGQESSVMRDGEIISGTIERIDAMNYSRTP